MMGMLQAGGIDPLTDNIRKADDDNPTGYCEWEPAKKLVKQPSLIEQAHGKALKLVSPWLSRLPKYHRYRVIFMMRPIEEIWNSQTVMKDNRGIDPKGDQKSKTIELMEAHRDQVL